MQYTQRKLHRSVTEMRRSRKGLLRVSVMVMVGSFSIVCFADVRAGKMLLVLYQLAVKGEAGHPLKKSGFLRL